MCICMCKCTVHHLWVPFLDRFRGPCRNFGIWPESVSGKGLPSRKRPLWPAWLVQSDVTGTPFGGWNGPMKDIICHVKICQKHRGIWTQNLEFMLHFTRFFKFPLSTLPFKRVYHCFTKNICPARNGEISQFPSFCEGIGVCRPEDAL